MSDHAGTNPVPLGIMRITLFFPVFLPRGCKARMSNGAVDG